MTNQTKKDTGGTRAERTRREILLAAEQLFASRGYASTRLEDVADEVGYTRAALFYHFKDKQTLYEAMISNAFGMIDQELHEILSAEKSISARLQSAVEVWIDGIIANPNLAKLILRFVVDDGDFGIDKIYSDNLFVPINFFSIFEEGKKSGELKPLHDDPFHVASAVIGTTVFYVSAMARLIPDSRVSKPSAKQLKNYKKEALISAKNLLGIS